MNTPPRIAVIGLGLIAQAAHLPALRSLGDRVVVTHLCDLAGDLAAGVAATGWGDARVTTDWREIADADVDAVVICTPGSHGRIAEACLAAGKHVLAEKPLSLSLAETDRLRTAAATTGTVLQVGYMKAHEPMVRAAAERLAEIGPLRHVRITVMHPADEPQVAHLRLLRGRSDPDALEIDAAHRHEAAETARALGEVPGSIAAFYTDVLNGSVVHQLSLLRALVGQVPATWSSALVAPLTAGDRLDEPPCIQAIAPLDDDTTVALSWNWVPDQPTYREFAELIGTSGSMHLTLSPPYTYEPPMLTVRRGSGDGEVVASTTGPPIDAFRHQMAAFVDAIEGSSEVVATADHARADIRSMMSLTALAANGIGVSVGGEAAS